MISVRDYANQQGCGESIIYRHIRNHKNELGDNVQKVHGKTYLTDDGAEFIRSLMKQQPIVISDTNEEIEKLKEENRQLLQSLNLAKDKIISLQEQNSTLAVENAKIGLLEAENDKKEEILKEKEKTAQEASERLTEVSEQLEKEKNRRISFKEYWQRRK